MSSTNTENIAIYNCLREPPILTVIIGAKCSDGIVLVADRKITDMSGEVICFTDKIFGDAEHVLIGYSGGVETFDIFRKYIVGDITLFRSDNEKRYTFDNFIEKASFCVRRFNKFTSNLNFSFEILVGKHRTKKSELHYINYKGNANMIDYVSIGSGKKTADMFLEKVRTDEIAMKDFAKHAYLAIMYMNQFLPDIRVGVEPNAFPLVKYLDYDEIWDKEASEQDINEFRSYSEKKLREHNNQFTKLINSL